METYHININKTFIKIESWKKGLRIKHETLDPGINSIFLQLQLCQIFRPNMRDWEIVCSTTMIDNQGFSLIFDLKYSKEKTVE